MPMDCTEAPMAETETRWRRLRLRLKPERKE
jgi:hypothetical protein